MDEIPYEAWLIVCLFLLDESVKQD